MTESDIIVIEVSRQWFILDELPLKTVSLIILSLCVILKTPTVQATDTLEQIRKSAEQRLHCCGLYLPGIEISISSDHIATLTGTVETDIVEAEVVEILQMTDGIRGVINQLKVAP